MTKKVKGQYSFFNLEERLEKIHQLNSFLLRLSMLINWEIFRSDLNKVREKERLSNAGRPAFDVVLMFKVLILKTLYNLSDEATELMIRDRISFMEFLGLTFADRVPDAKTIWLFAEQLKELGLERKLFDRFGEELDRQGFAAKGGYIVDGTFVEVPRRRLTKEENAQLQSGEIPESITSNPRVEAQTDLDAEWAKKGNETHFGYKDHVLGDEGYKLIRDYDASGAATHDSVPYPDLMPEKPLFEGQGAYADSAYTGKEIDAKLRARGYTPQICEKGYRNHPLTDDQKENNRKKSKVRCRVEHIFGAMKSRCRDEVLRTIGFARAKFWIGMRNLTYNLSRFVSLKSPQPVRKHPQPIKKCQQPAQ
jgi:IS5 family transposase